MMLFAIAGGLTLSGIVANAYRLIAKKPHTVVGKAGYYLVMLLAGPSVLVENSTRSFRAKECSRAAYAFAVGIAAYWSFMIGLAMIEAGAVI